MEFAVVILEGLYEKYGVDLVVTQPDKPVGRKRIVQGTPVKNKAVELGIEVFQPLNIKKDNHRILSDSFDFIIVCAYGQIIPEVVLHHARFQAINVHASLLPKYRGGSPMHYAIINGDEETGVSVMYMEKRMDSGKVLSQKKIKILRQDNVKTLEDKLAVIGRDLLIDTLDNILSNRAKALAQDEDLVTYAYNFKDDQLVIDFTKPAKDIFNHVRGMNPWPIAFLIVDEKKLKIYDTDFCDDNYSTIIGEITRIDKSGVYIQTGFGQIILKEVKLEGKNKLKINEFMNGTGKTLFYQGKILKGSL